MRVSRPFLAVCDGRASSDARTIKATRWSPLSLKDSLEQLEFDGKYGRLGAVRAEWSSLFNPILFRGVIEGIPILDPKCPRGLYRGAGMPVFTPFQY
jgi:hypothetical protein